MQIESFLLWARVKQQTASKEDSHFTVLGITAATEGTLCGVLFEGVVRR